MWSKKPTSRKGLRCKIAVTHKGELFPCNRPARRYGQQVKVWWNDGELMDIGPIDCCVNHHRLLAKQGVILTWIDRRRTANP